LAIGALPAHAQSSPLPSTDLAWPATSVQAGVPPANPIQETVDPKEAEEDFNIPPVNDPLEPINRVTLEFNQQLDDWVIRPTAKVYEAVVPPPVRQVVSNVFGNLADLWSGTNNLLQGKPRDAGSDTLRFLINSTVGLGGIVDVASDFGLPKHKEDFGQTLGRWGFPEGPYLVLPLFGPSTLRDAVGTFAVDLQANPFRALPDPGARNAITATRLIDARARLLSGDRLFDEISIDRYLFIRDAYLQRRESQIWDGDPPPRSRKVSRP
jgi:phospholipid-binding lipoprotein MlaA